MISIDQSKAFDSVDHGYMCKVYEFFNFGPKIQRWLAAIGTHRKARISLGEGKFTNYFCLGRGHAQGDSPSPLLYNFAAQILLFKIELTPSIERIRNHDFFPGKAKPQKGNLYESNKETGKCDCFADDNSTMTIFSARNLLALKRILEEFRILSGLKTNIEKSAVLRIGKTSADIPNEILEVGFDIKDQITLLGFQVSNNDDIVEVNFESAIEKILKIVRFWNRFNLTLPGKINIYKTLLLSQVTYKATILKPSKHIINRLDAIFEKFVLKGFSISKSRIYQSPKKGGLGMINLENFVEGLQTAWVGRAIRECSDNWRYDILDYFNFDLESTEKRNTGVFLGTTLKNIVESTEKFLKQFTFVGNNFLKERLLSNSKFGYGRNMANKFDEGFWGEENCNNRLLPKLSWTELVDANANFLNKDILCETTGLIMTNEKYQKLKNTYEICAKRYFKKTNKCIGVTEFFEKNVKGSKRYRKIIENNTNEQKISNLTQFKTFKKNLTDNEGNERVAQNSIPESRLSAIYSSWTKIFYTNRQKVFLFKLYNNTLGLNTRVTHINNTVSPECTFCVIEKNLPAEKETMLHILYHCPTTIKWYREWFTKCCTVPLPDPDLFFTGYIADTEDTNAGAQFIFETLMYTVWQAKLEKKYIARANS